MIATSLNQLAHARQLAPFETWIDQKAPAGYFTRDQLAQAAEFYRENGFIVLQDGLSHAEIDALNAEAAEICQGNRGAIRGSEPALPGESQLDILRKYLCIHFPHKISEHMHDTLAHPSIVDVLTRTIGPNVKCMQSMLFIKASGKPGQAWHQDEYFIPTRDRSLAGAWIAMDDATVENGCLWVIPGSHKHGIIWPQRKHDDRRFDCTGEAMFFPYTDDDAVPVEVKKGSIVFFNGYLLHRSLPNYAATGFRRSLVNHYMSAESLLPWHGFGPNQAIATADYRDIVMVAGQDPYAWKGTQDIASAHVRPSGEGGCGSPERNSAKPGEMGGGAMGGMGGSMGGSMGGGAMGAAHDDFDDDDHDH